MLINLATAEYMRENLQEALKYYEHALTVISNTTQEKALGGVTLDAEAAKIYLSIAHIQ